jgi:hypothetical protein
MEASQYLENIKSRLISSNTIYDHFQLKKLMLIKGWGGTVIIKNTAFDAVVP